MNVKSYNTMAYENKSNWTLGQNKPNSNPILERKPILERMNVNFYVAGYYESKPTFAANNPNVDINTAFSCGARIVA